MTETFAEKEARGKKAPGMLPSISRVQADHTPLSSMALASRHMRIQTEQTRMGSKAVSAADIDMRIANNLSRLRTDSADISKRFLQMLERAGTG
ncbi:MAG: hypothetical protein AB1295_00610 [Candidatus Micrarchaeota archaeon]